MADRLAKLTALAAIAVGIIAIPTVNAMPSPIELCTLRPPFDCISARISGAHYIQGDSPAAPVFFITSLVLAPLLSVGAVWLFGHRRRWLGTTLAAVAVLPNLVLLLAGGLLTLFHPVVLALTLATLAGLLLAPFVHATRSARAIS